MSFKWETKEDKKIEISEIDLSFDEVLEEQCKVYCDIFTTCRNPDAIRTEKRVKACWDNIRNLRYDKITGCHYKIKGVILIYYNFGECPKCGELYFSIIDGKCKYEDLNELCRECE